MFIYPAIDLLGGQCVRLKQGDYTRVTVFSDDPATMAEQWVSQGADRLHLVDLDGAKAGVPINAAAIQQIASKVNVPLQLGGGLRMEDDLKRVFDWGVHWAVLGTKALHDPGWLAAMAEKYPQRLVLGLDARDGYVATDGWLETSTTKATDLALQLQAAPLFALVYTDIATDGMMQGPNYAALEEMRTATALPVIASGGISNLDQAIRLADASTFGCIVGRALYDGTVTLPELLALSSGKSA
jgi:phosphoribosylformimino-5-aminoimidazole carboxamide ribotide isomerase